MPTTIAAKRVCRGHSPPYAIRSDETGPLLRLSICNTRASVARPSQCGTQSPNQNRSLESQPNAAPVVRSDLLRRYPELRGVLTLLADGLDDAEMRRLNFEVDDHRSRPEDAAREYLQSRGLTP